MDDTEDATCESTLFRPGAMCGLTRKLEVKEFLGGGCVVYRIYLCMYVHAHYVWKLYTQLYVYLG